MNVFQKCGVLALAMIMTATPALAEKNAPSPPSGKNEFVEHGWTKRCDKQPKGAKTGGPKTCEIFLRIDMKDSTTRVVEFAVGFGKNAKKGEAQGVLILPLGILLEHSIAMKIDGSKPSFINVLACVKKGCFAHVNLSRKLFDAMKKGKVVTFEFESANGRNMKLIMHLEGFETALKGIQ